MFVTALDKSDGDERGGVRAGERTVVNKASVARIAGDSAYPIEVVDYSRGGCAFVSDQSIGIGEHVRVGLSGAGSHECEVVWRDGDRYGCTFVAPLGEADMARAFKGPALIHIHRPLEGLPEPQEPVRFSRRMRTLILVGGGVAAWALVAAAVAAVMMIA